VDLWGVVRQFGRCEPLVAADYGVPQTRIRVFYIGNRIGVANPCPTPTHAKPPRHTMFGLKPWVTVRQALGIGGPEHDLLSGPSATIRAGAHGQPGYSPRHQAGYVPVLDDPSATIHAMDGGPASKDRTRFAGYVPTESLPNIQLDVPSPTIQGGGADTGGAEPVRHRLTNRTDHGLLDLDSPSCAIKAGGNREADGHMVGPCPPSIRLRNRYAEHGDGATFDEPAPTVSADRGLDVTAEIRLRRLTVRECATLQNFPEWFSFSGSMTSQYRQVGNAVAVGMGRAVGEAITQAYARAILDAA
jgi:site-specific DNA-cytosine methylase